MAKKNRDYLKPINFTETELQHLVNILSVLEPFSDMDREMKAVDKALERSGIFREGESYTESEPVKK